ncbi:MAG: hypothetical protein ACLTLQ_04310 [[Clostridium] scindens]
MKKKVVKYSLLALLIILAAFSQTLSMKADIGVCACWDSVSMNVYQITGTKVGTFSISGESGLRGDPTCADSEERISTREILTDLAVAILFETLCNERSILSCTGF